MMPRARRWLQSNVVYHVYNRRTDKQCLFPDTDSYDDFVDVIRRANRRHDARLHAYCLLHTHVHLAVSAQKPQELQRFLRWVASTHAIRFRRKTNTRGLGHVYQDRYKSNGVEDAVHYATLIRYIERNPVEAGVVERAQDWPWSSVRERMSGGYDLIQPGPWTLPSNWLQLVNAETVNMADVSWLLGQRSSLPIAPTAFPEFSPRR